MLRRFRLPLLILAVLLVPLAGGAGSWVWAKNVYTENWEEWLAARRAEGYSFRNPAPDTTGFPSRIALRLDGFAMSGPEGWHWQPPTMTGEASLLAPFEMALQGAGEHIVVTPGGRRLSVTAESADGKLAFEPEKGIETGHLLLETITVAGLPAGAVTADSLRTELGPRRQKGTGLPRTDFAATAEGVALPPTVDTPFGRTMEALEIRGTLKGDLPAGGDARALHAWRKAGGGIDVDHVRLVWPPMTMTGDGRLSLDGKLRPEGTLRMAVQGLGPALDRLAKAGVLDAKAANYAKLVLVALGRKTTDGSGGTTMDVPVSFRDGRLFLGPVPVMRLSPVLEDRTSRLGALR